MQPVFSFIIPCYNHGEHLRGAIRSVEAIQDMPCEIIIVDDGSEQEATVKELKILEGEGYMVIYQPNAGPGAARNNGIANARGRYIVPLDADDRIRAEYITNAFEILEHSPDIGAVYSDFKRFGASEAAEYHKAYSVQGLLLDNVVGSCVIFRKSAWETVGGYDEQLKKGYGWEDWEFWINLAAHGFKFQHIDVIRYDYFLSPNSRERSYLQIKYKVNATISYLENKHKGFYDPSAIHESLINQITKHPLGMFLKIFLAVCFPSIYGSLVKKGKIRKYLV